MHDLVSQKAIESENTKILTHCVVAATSLTGKKKEERIVLERKIPQTSNVRAPESEFRVCEGHQQRHLPPLVQEAETINTASSENGKEMCST